MSTIPKGNILTGNTILASDVLAIIEALDGTTNRDISVDVLNCNTLKIGNTSIFAKQNSWTADQYIITASDPSFLVGAATTGGVYGIMQWATVEQWLSLTTGGSTFPIRLQVLGGKVAIGNIDPTVSLDVVGAIKGSLSAITLTDVAGAGAMKYASNHIYFHNGSGWTQLAEV